MIKLALIGYPLSHSYSQIIHEAAFKTLGIEGTYEILETKPEDLVDRIKYLKTNDYKGFNVTIPHKVPVTIFLNDVDDLTQCAGSSNTIKINEDKTLSGFNTDIYGFKAAIPKSFLPELKNSKVAIMGAGGASRACVVAFAQLGVKQIDFYVRNILNARKSIEFFREQFKNIHFNVIQNQLLTDLSSYKMVVNATPLGMKNYAMDMTPIDNPVVRTMDKSAILYDLVYNPMKTNLIKNAEYHHIPTISGIDMLIYQAQKAFEIWTGQLPEFKDLKIALLEKLI